PVAYLARVQPVGTPPITPTATATATAVPTSTAVPIPTATPQPAPPQTRDARYFPQTGYRVESDVVWDVFQTRGGLETFGFPISRTFTFLGCPVQMFQRPI